MTPNVIKVSISLQKTIPINGEQRQQKNQHISFNLLAKRISKDLTTINTVRRVIYKNNIFLNNHKYAHPKKVNASSPRAERNPPPYQLFLPLRSISLSINVRSIGIPI